MTSFWRKGSDGLKNGTILGALMGIGIIFGTQILTFFEGIVPNTWLYLGTWSIPIYIIAIFAVIGYSVDRR